MPLKNPIHWSLVFVSAIFCVVLALNEPVNFKVEAIATAVTILLVVLAVSEWIHSTTSKQKRAQLQRIDENAEAVQCITAVLRANCTESGVLDTPPYRAAVQHLLSSPSALHNGSFTLLVDELGRHQQLSWPAIEQLIAALTLTVRENDINIHRYIRSN